MLPTCNRKLVPKLHSAALLNAVQHWSFTTWKNTYWHAPLCVCLLARATGSRSLEKSWSLLVEELSSAKYQQQDRCSTSSSASARFGTRDKHLRRTMWNCSPLPLTCQRPGDASVSKVKLSSSCLLALYCTSFACCYSKNRTDSSSGRTTTDNKTTQANSLLNICSLWVLKAHGSARVQTHNGDHHWWGAELPPSLKSQSHQNTTDQLKICGLETVSTGKLQHPPFSKQEVVALHYSLWGSSGTMFLYSDFCPFGRLVLKTYACIYIHVLYPEKVLHLDTENEGAQSNTCVLLKLLLASLAIPHIIFPEFLQQFLISE